MDGNDTRTTIPYTDVPDNVGRMSWDGPHKRILFESEDPDSTASGSEIQEARPGWPPDVWAQGLGPSKVVPAEMAKEASTEGPTDI